MVNTRDGVALSMRLTMVCIRQSDMSKFDMTWRRWK
jgi:hypothetical protein